MYKFILDKFLDLTIDFLIRANDFIQNPIKTGTTSVGTITAFSGINLACKIYSVNAYKIATNWSTYANYIYPLSSKPTS